MRKRPRTGNYGVAFSSKGKSLLIPEVVNLEIGRFEVTIGQFQSFSQDQQPAKPTKPYPLRTRAGIYWIPRGARRGKACGRKAIVGQAFLPVSLSRAEKKEHRLKPVPLWRLRL